MNDSNLEHVNCDICGHNVYDMFMKINDYRHDVKDEYCVVRCKKCGVLFTNPRLAEQSVNAESEGCFGPWDENKSKAERESSRFARRHPALRKMWHLIMGEYLSEILERSRGKALDLGCGFGDILEDLAIRGCDAYGVETNPKAAEACRKKGLKVFCGTLEDAHFENEFFDTVILFHVVEHLPYPKAVLKEIHRILKPGGLVMVYCPNANSYIADLFGKYWQGWAIPLHLYHFTAKTIRSLAEGTGFRVDRIRAVTPEYFFLHSLNRYIRNGDNKILSGLQKLGVFNYNIFSRLIIAIIARIMDLILLGKGECLRAELRKEVIG